jgi:hypothetical protein
VTALICVRSHTQFETHFLKLDLLDDGKHKMALLTATLKVRRDPTGKQSSVDSDDTSSASRSVSASPMRDSGASTKLSASDATAIVTATVPSVTREPENDEKRESGIEENLSVAGSDDVGASGARRRHKLLTSKVSDASKPPSELGDEPDDTAAIGDDDAASADKLRRRSSQQNASRSRATGTSMSVSGGGGGVDDDNLSPPSRRRGERPSKAVTQPSSPRDDTPVTPPAPRRAQTELDTAAASSSGGTSLPTSPGSLRHRGSLDADTLHDQPQRLTRMESLRADNLRKYGHRQPSSQQRTPDGQPSAAAAAAAAAAASAAAAAVVAATQSGAAAAASPATVRCTLRVCESL